MDKKVYRIDIERRNTAERKPKEKMGRHIHAKNRAGLDDQSQGQTILEKYERGLRQEGDNYWLNERALLQNWIENLRGGAIVCAADLHIATGQI